MHEINGCRVITFENNNFKTNSISFNIIQDLNLDTATKNALLMKVLRRGCIEFESSKEIATELESCFGATLAVKIEKAGDNQIIGFVCSYPADEFVGERLTLRLVDLLMALIFNPLREVGGFRTDYLEQERANLREQIEGLKDDKRSYALQRCTELMFPDEPYGLSEIGDLEQLDQITNAELFAHYQNLLQTAQMVVFLSGRFDESIENEFVQILKTKLRRDVTAKELGRIKCKEGFSAAESGGEKAFEFIEEMDVTQGKLTIGFTTETLPSSDEYVDLMVVNSIFGGGMHSKLFTEVREKQSLAYYAMTMMDKFKGVIFAAAGIDLQNKEKTQNLILEQLENVQNGKISDFELTSAKKALINSLRSLNDSQLSVQAFYFGQLLADSEFTIELLIEKIANVKLPAVIDVSKRIQPHTIYFMTSSPEMGVSS